MKDVFSRTRKPRQSGVAMSEYLPIVGLIAVLLIGGMGSVGDVLRDQGSKMAQEMAGDDAGHRLPPSNGNGSVDFPSDTSPGSGDEEETPDTGGGSGSEPDSRTLPDITLDHSCSQRPLLWIRDLVSSSTSAPANFHLIPEPHSRCLTNVLHAASVTPEPIGQLCSRAS
ncbi:Flp family type IVb pilin [Endozoicomonas acroporae]|uniref:Flp family type IVb pilin n=1 Tax=Endozoicomonas acroporae TaxID=1701104 RepID=UPI0013D31DB9|nr:hypothetical protein [Endozoicomonas acroporae]